MHPQKSDYMRFHAFRFCAVFCCRVHGLCDLGSGGGSHSRVGSSYAPLGRSVVPLCINRCTTHSGVWLPTEGGACLDKCRYNAKSYRIFCRSGECEYLECCFLRRGIECDFRCDLHCGKRQLGFSYETFSSHRTASMAPSMAPVLKILVAHSPGRHYRFHSARASGGGDSGFVAYA